MKTIDDMLREVAQIKGIERGVPQAAQSAATDIAMRPTLCLSLAKEITYCIEKAAESMGLYVVTAITDAGGRLILLEAMDNSLIASITAAQEKVYTAVALKMPTHEALKASRGGAFDGLTNGGGILMLGGGYPIECEGAVIGGIGVSGGTKDQDEALARAGVLYANERLNNIDRKRG